MNSPIAPVSSRQANLVLFVLLLTYTVSFIDRTAIGVIQEPIKHELGLSDWQLGLLTGPAFAILYSLTGVPIARLADRYSRTWIIATCVFAWSLMTLFCGLAQNYAQLLLARIGVSIGEAGGNPASHSLIADLYPPERRARAISIYSFGAPCGAFLGAVLAGLLAYWWGWRAAFLLLGPAGFVLALAVVLLIPRVPRGLYDRKPLQEEIPSMGSVLRLLGGNPAFRQLVSGAALIVLVGYGVAAFVPPFFIRVHGQEMSQVGLIAGLVNGVAGVVGTLFGGFAADRFGARDIRLYAWIPAALSLAAAPCLVAGFAVGDLWLSTALLMLGTAGFYTYLAPTFAQVHAMVDSRTRATATSVVYLIINLVGLGLGPPVIGLISDKAAAASFLASTGGIFSARCTTRAPEAADAAACAAASAHGITVALIAVSLLLVWAAIHLWLAGFRLARSAAPAPESSGP